jgi:hypothetical protein
MQTKESYWEGMYWDGLDARDLGAIHIPELVSTVEQMFQEGELNDSNGLVLRTKVVPEFQNLVKTLESRPEEEYWVTMVQEDDSEKLPIFKMHVWHQDVFFGSRAMGIVNPGELCMTYEFNADTGAFRKRGPMQ